MKFAIIYDQPPVVFDDANKFLPWFRITYNYYMQDLILVDEGTSTQIWIRGQNAGPVAIIDEIKYIN